MHPSLRYATLILCALSVIAWLPWLIRNRAKRLYIVAPFTWIAHVAVFNIVRLLEIPIPIATINMWSASLTLHALLLFLGGGVVFIRRLRE